MSSGIRFGAVAVALALAIGMLGCGSDSDSTGGAAGAGGTGSAPIQPLGPIYDGPPGPFVDITPCPLPRSWPTAMSFRSSAFDSSRGKLLFFPGSNSSAEMQIWDWDGTMARFTERTPCDIRAVLPIGNSGYSAAYDPTRGVIVLYGIVQRPATDDVATLEFNPTTGALVDVTPESPEWNWPSGPALMFYDPTIGSVAMVGTPNLWVWDAEARTWVAGDPVPPAPVLWNGPTVYDPGRRKLYLFSVNSTRDLIEVAELDLTMAEWQVRTPPPPLPIDWPLGANTTSAALDAARDRVVLTGESSEGTWEWDPVSGSMTKIVASDPEAVATSALLAYDAATERVTAVPRYGTDTYFADVMTWDGAVWTRHRPEHIAQPWPDPAHSPEVPFEANIEATFDWDRRVAVIYYQSRADEPTGALLEWDGSAWTDRTPSDALRSPSARTDHALAYDKSRQRVVLYGGRSKSSGSELNDLWEWDGAGGTWTNRTPAALPAEWPSPEPHKTPLVFDETLGSILLYEGAGRTWRWNGEAGSWTAFPLPDSILSNAPAAASGLVYDERLRASFLLGTQGVWRLNYETRSWDLVPLVGEAWSFLVSAVTFDRARGTMMVASDRLTAEVWSYSTAEGSWSNETPAPLLEAWTSAVQAMTYDAAREKLLILFGNGHLIERASR